MRWLFLALILLLLGIAGTAHVYPWIKSRDDWNAYRRIRAYWVTYGISIAAAIGILLLILLAWLLKL